MALYIVHYDSHVHGRVETWPTVFRHGPIFHLEIALLIDWRFIHNRDAKTNTLGGWRGHFLNHMQKTGPKLDVFHGFLAIFLSFFDKSYTTNFKTFINFEKKLKKVENFP